MKFDEKTVEQSIKASCIALTQAYAIVKRIKLEDAKIEVGKFLTTLAAGEFKHDPYLQYKAIVREAVDVLVSHYKDSQAMAYVGLLKLQEMLR